MMIPARLIAMLVSAALGSAMHLARADDSAALTHEILTMDAAASSGGSSVVTGRIASDFTSFAGSRENATSLVTGLRNGSQITLTQRGYRPVTFTPPTQPMGYGNVSTSLALAQYQLAQQGIVNPTPEQLKIALNGGTIVVNGQPVVYQGVLQMRADGMGWGEIAQQLGTKLGPVVSGIKAQNTRLGPTPHARAASGTTTATGAAAANAASRGGGSQAAGKGIVNAGGGATDIGPAKGKSESGVTAASGRPAQAGRGIVSGSGQSVGPGAHAAGAVHGNSSAVTAAGSAAGGAAPTNPGQGKALGHSK